MTITYKPTKKEYDVEVTSIKDILAVTDTISPVEKSQHKTYIFSMTSAEKKIVLDYFKMHLSIQSGVPFCDVLKGQPTLKKIYLPNIGSIEIKNC